MFLITSNPAQGSPKTWLYGSTCQNGQRRFKSTGTFFQQLSNHFQAHLTEKANLKYFDICIFFSKKYFPWEARKVTPAKMAKLVYKCNRGSYSMSHLRWLSLSYQRIPYWHTDTKLVRRSNQNGNGYQLLYKAFTRYEPTAILAEPHPPYSKIQKLCILR